MRLHVGAVILIFALGRVLGTCYITSLGVYGEDKANMIVSPGASPILPRHHQRYRSMSHSVDVTASTVYEAVAQALAALRKHDWVAGIPQGTSVRVSVASVRVDHDVKMGDFERWLERTG